MNINLCDNDVNTRSFTVKSRIGCIVRKIREKYP